MGTKDIGEVEEERDRRALGIAAAPLLHQLGTLTIFILTSQTPSKRAPINSYIPHYTKHKGKKHITDVCYFLANVILILFSPSSL